MTKRLGNQSKANQLTEHVLEELDMRMKSQSLADIASYPYPKRQKENQDQPTQERHDHTLHQTRPVVVFVYPTRGETLHIECIQLEREVENWEDEGGHV